MTTWTIRLLSRKFSFSAPSVGNATGAAVHLNLARGLAEQVGDVAADQRALTTDEVERGLGDGTIRSTDLVHFDGQWVSLADSIPFADAAVAPARREARGRFFKSALLFGVVVAIFALQFWLRMER